MNGKQRFYLGVDIGGTKIQASLAEETGSVLAREKSATPRDGGPEKVLSAIEQAIQGVLEKGDVEAKRLTAAGIAVPGVVDPDTGRVVVTPNMSLTGVAIGPHLESHFRIPVVVGNDCNLGTLGEKWLGAARHADSAMGILVGTGIGGGFVQRGKLWRGARESASEIGHIVMEVGGPRCGCGNQGCFEALASRSAIERDIRQAIAEGKKSVLTELTGESFDLIRSSMLRQALDAGDRLVTDVMRRASEVLGYACLTVRHLLDPEVIVLGGGVVEACSEFIMPIVENIVGSDQLPGAREGGQVLLSALGDDAVVVGCVALARIHVGRSPFKKRFRVQPKYPELGPTSHGEITVGGKVYNRDVVIGVNGKVKKRNKKLARQQYGSSHTLGPKELEKACKGGPEILFIGTGHVGQVELSEDAERFLRQRSIECQPLPTPEAAEAYNRSNRRKAAIIHVTC